MPAIESSASISTVARFTQTLESIIREEELKIGDIRELEVYYLSLCIGRESPD
jgi:hypothetical protein